jgi:hypothetical protein
MTFMATGTAPALDPNLDPAKQTAQTRESQPQTFKQRFINLMHKMFAGREEHLGWRQ